MATLVIPTRTDGCPDYTFTIGLDGDTYRLRLLWQERSTSWYMDIQEVDGTPILSTRRLVLGLPLTFRYKDTRLPPGEFELQDTTAQDEEAGLFDLGSRVLLLYTEAADIPGVLR